MAYIEDILNNFKTKAMRMIVLLSVLGIIVSAYPTYDKIVNGGLEKRLVMLEKLSSIDNSTDSMIINLKKQSIEEFQAYPKNYEIYQGNLFSQASYKPYYTFLFKFLTGGALFFIVYFTQACAVSIRSRRSVLQRITLAEIIKINTPSLFIWLSFSVGNMILPMFGGVINYLFIPSCMTFIYAFFEIIYNEAGDKITSHRDDDFTGLIKT